MRNRALRLLPALLMFLVLLVPQLSMAQDIPDYMVVEKVMVTMRDGTQLFTVISRPKAKGQYPALLERTPYNATRSITNPETHLFVQQGYVVVWQDVRGRFGSKGKFYPNRDDGWGENQDGYDTIEWIAAQSWCNGKVGSMGGSQSAQTVYNLTVTQPPHLVASFARESASDLWGEWYYHGGAFEFGFVTRWTFNNFGPDILAKTLNGNALSAAKTQLEEYLALKEDFEDVMPLTNFELLKLSPGFQFYRDWLTNPTDGPYWWDQSSGNHSNEVAVPVLHLGGWYDIFLDGTLKHFMDNRANAATERARNGQKLVIGPWIHGPTWVGTTEVGSMTYPGADQVSMNIRLPWFDYWLKGVDNGIMDTPPVLLYVMGDNVWRYENEWPLARTEYTKFYLNSGNSGSIESLNDGRLTPVPVEVPAADSFDYDPMNPIPTMGGNCLFIPTGPRDHSTVEQRMLTYTSEVLTQPLEVTGPVKAVLYVSSSAVDTDFVVRVSEVYPDGKSMIVVDGIQRARFRESGMNPTLLKPGEIYEIEVDLWSTSTVFQPGNRIRVSIESSNFPRWSRNMNVAEFPEQATKYEVAKNTIYLSSEHPSHVLLPVIPR